MAHNATHFRQPHGDEGIDHRTLQELMGHKAVSLTLRYAHLSPQHNLAAI